MRIETAPDAAAKLNSYPAEVWPKVAELRQLILDTASAADIEVLVETLKWGEPSYLAKGGSTLRFDWKERAPERLSLFFVCTTRLLPTIRSIYRNRFAYEKNRAIHLALSAPLPRTALAECIRMALC